MWQFWIDVGGTFTDGIARAPDGRLVTHKTLSSGAVKGRVEQRTGPRSWIDVRRAGDPPGLWVGWRVVCGDFTAAAVAEPAPWPTSAPRSISDQ